MTAIAFDTLKVAKRLKDAGFTEQQAEAGIALVSSSCASTMCRLELSAQDPTELARFATEFSFQLGWNATARLHNTANPDGTATSVVYLSRDRYGLPEARE
ncbi:MAG: hypothetical protein ACREXX_09055 [Gammaproteobacteria bacterium]